jgi:exodeoxyribonuclease VII small subunit
MPKAPDAAPEPAPGFEASLDELEKVTQQLENGELPLERALELFEQGMKLSEQCRKQLEEAETRVEILLKKNGQTAAEPFQPDKT